MSINATLEKILNPMNRKDIILWILRKKLIPIKLQLDNLSQAKQLRFCFETTKFFSQSVSQ